MGKSDNRVFIDANFFIALYNPYDSQHKKALKYSEKIQEYDLRPVISNFIFLEATTVISQRVGRDFAIRAGNKLYKNDVFDYIHIDDELQEKSWQFFQSIDRKNMSFVDCSILAVMEQEGIQQLLTFDTKDFASLRKRYAFNFYSL